MKLFFLIFNTSKIRMLTKVDLFSAVVTGDTPEEMYARVKDVIDSQSGPTIWVPCRDQPL
jgi:hypothetical protein